MSPTLRSVFTQLQRKSRPVGGSSRNFSSTTCSNEELPFLAWLFTRGVGVTLGYGSVQIMFSEIASRTVDKRQKKLEKRKETLEKDRKWMSDLVASRGKS